MDISCRIDGQWRIWASVAFGPFRGYGRCIVVFYIVKFLFVHECGDVRHEKMHDEMHDEKMHEIQISRNLQMFIYVSLLSGRRFGLA